MHHHYGDPRRRSCRGWSGWPRRSTDRLSRRRVKQWCRRQGFQLLRWRDAKLFEGPSTWTIHHDRYRIQVLDQDGRRRAGYPGVPALVEHGSARQVLWDEPSRARVNGSTVASRAQILK